MAVPKNAVPVLVFRISVPNPNFTKPHFQYLLKGEAGLECKKLAYFYEFIWLNKGINRKSVNRLII